MELTESAREKYKDLVIQHQREQSDGLSAEQSLSFHEEETIPSISLPIVDTAPVITNSFHQQSSSFPFQVLPSFSEDRNDRKNATVSHQTCSNSFRSNHDTDADKFCSENRQVSCEEKRSNRRSLDIRGGKTESCEQVDSSQLLLERNDTALVAHQEIKLNISISDSLHQAGSK